MKIAPHRTIRYYRLRFVRLQGAPEVLARGVALGTFIGITPTIPLHTISILLLAIMMRSSKIAALLASIVVSNPLTFFPQYYLSWRLGNWLLNANLSWERINKVTAVLASDGGFQASLAALGSLGGEALTVMLLGGAVLALPFSLAAYYMSLYFFVTIRNRRLKKLY